MSLDTLLAPLRALDPVSRAGKICSIMPTYIEADGPAVSIGAICAIETAGTGGETLAEVVRVGRDSITLAPFEDGPETFPGARVTAHSLTPAVPVGDAFLGRAVDALGRPIDGGPPVRATASAPIDGIPTGPLDRDTPRRILETGIRAIDGLLTLGQGQRVGVFAASGVGKTTLMSQLARQVEADCCVVCLVGERGREVEAMWSGGLSPEARARTVMVAATSDQAAAMRVRAGDYALALAEHWRAQGRHVLLFIDSVTRLAMAMREIGLAAGEPPTVRAYTPSVFAAIPKVVERCGALKAGGAITAIMTVLSETDDIDDPVCEMMKSLLDGHVILSRELAEHGHFPALDVPRSISRLARELAGPARSAAADAARALLATFENSRTMIEAGIYARGSDAAIDRAIERRPALTAFLRQEGTERVGYDAGCAALDRLLGGAR